MYHDKAVMSSTKCPWLPQANFKLASWNAFYPDIHCVLHLAFWSRIPCLTVTWILGTDENTWNKIEIDVLHCFICFAHDIAKKRSTVFSPFPLFVRKAVHALYISHKALNMLLIKILLHQRLLLKLRSILSAG